MVGLGLDLEGTQPSNPGLDFYFVNKNIQLHKTGLHEKLKHRFRWEYVGIF
jgi:hypothetical protein